MSAPDRSGQPGPREASTAPEASPRHPPHVEENAEDAPVQDSSVAPNDVPTLPPNASGRDKVPNTHQPKQTRPSSMYDQRPAENKDHPQNGQ